MTTKKDLINILSLAIDMSPVSRALADARLRLDRHQFIEHFFQTLGHMWA